MRGPKTLAGLAAGLLLALTCAIGCGRRPPDATPEGALDAFLHAMEEAPHDPGATARAYGLLSPEAREALRVRAARATAITGKPVTPEAMLAPAWAPLRFSVERTATTFEPDGVHATVDVYGVDPTTQHVRIPLVRENDRYRVVVELP